MPSAEQDATDGPFEQVEHRIATGTAAAQPRQQQQWRTTPQHRQSNPGRSSPGADRPHSGSATQPHETGTVVTLNHVNLCISDVPALADTLVTHFDYRLVDAGSVPARDGSGDSHFAAVVGPDDSLLVITQIPAPAPGQSAYPAGFHFGLIQPSRDHVLAKHAELTAAGFQPTKINDGFEVWGSTWTAFYCPLGDGLEIEINYGTPSDALRHASVAAGGRS